MKHMNFAPVIASGLSGLVVGVLLTLAVTGVVSPSANKGLPTVVPITPRISQQAHVDDQIRRLVIAKLGPASPNPKLSRLMRVSALPSASSPGAVHGTTHPRTPYKSLDIVFRLNDHPLGKSWRLRAARGDVFRVLKGLYTSGLPVFDIRMDGEFALGRANAANLSTAVSVYMDHATAERIAWKRIDRSNENQVWRALKFVRVDPRFG